MNEYVNNESDSDQEMPKEEITDIPMVLLDFSHTVKAAPHECVIRTSQP